MNTVAGDLIQFPGMGPQQEEPGRLLSRAPPLTVPGLQAEQMRAGVLTKVQFIYTMAGVTRAHGAVSKGFTSSWPQHLPFILHTSRPWPHPWIAV